jgi:dipeptidyl aminopeptidase/acylaminoacyl peptidase
MNRPDDQPDATAMSTSGTNARNNKDTLPYGTWPSSLTADDVAAQSRRLTEPQLCGGKIFWLETRPSEQGRVQVMMREADGALHDLLPSGFSARSRVHEYGGGSYLATEDSLYFVNDSDQQIYRLALSQKPQGGTPLALTPAGEQGFADLSLDLARQRLFAVCEDHAGSQGAVANYIVAIPLNGSQKLQRMAEGSDFYSNPRLSPDGTRLSWLSWNHPDMPWDASQLWVADLSPDGSPQPARCVAGNSGTESVFQPTWSPDGILYFVSDRDNWWNIYRIPTLSEQNFETEKVTDLQAEFATPQWTFNMSTYGFLDANRLLATYTRKGHWYLATIDLGRRQLDPVISELNQFSALHCQESTGVFVGASPTRTGDIYLYQAGKIQPITRSRALLNPADISLPLDISFDTSEKAKAHAFFYAPVHQAVAGPADSQPPVIVICHGGPTGTTDTSLNLKIQYWTNRGFAVLDVNYRGSTGYGREYRQALYKNWGLRDLDDVCAAVLHVTEQGWVHPHQRIIKGSSAGGYTVLAALTFRDVFDAGVSLYGVGDLELLARDTHKFEAHYLDSLVGPYPAEKARYRKLSPIHCVDQLRCPLLVFQGLKDKVVPPNQAEAMVEAVAAQKVPVAYVTYDSEGHGFRQAENIAHMLTAEQYFYQRVFALGNTPNKSIITIKNLDDSQ